MRRSIFDDKPVLRLPCDRVNKNRFKIAHLWFQRAAYHKSPCKSIPKTEQNILKISTGNTPLSALAQFIDFCANHTYSSYLFNYGTFQLKSDESGPIAGPPIHPLIQLSINMPPDVYNYLYVIVFSVTDPRARGMIFFLSESRFFVSSQPAHFLFLYAPSCCCGGGQVCFQWFIDEPSFPTPHGLKAHDFFIVKRDATSFDSWLLTHAALVLFKKKEPRRSRRDTLKKPRHAKKNIRPGMAITQITQIHTDDFINGEPTISPFSPTIKKSEDNKMNDNEMIDKELIPLLPVIGERIKKFREYRVLTTQKMAQLTDMPDSTISQVEAGETPIPIPMLINLCQHLGADINWVLTGKESMVKEKTKPYNPDNIPLGDLTQNDTPPLPNCLQ